MRDIFAGLYNKIIGFFSNTEQKEADESKNVARNRLKLVLMQDRTNLNPYLLERMRGELIDLLSKYVEMDKEALDLNFENDGDSIALMLSIPVIRAKEEEEIEAALKAEDDAKKELEEKLKALEEQENDDSEEDEDDEDDEDDSESDDEAEDDEADMWIEGDGKGYPMNEEELSSENSDEQISSDDSEPNEKPRHKKKKKHKKKKAILNIPDIIEVNEVSEEETEEAEENSETQNDENVESNSGEQTDNT